MKALFLLLIAPLLAAESANFYQAAKDFISSGTHKIIFADNVSLQVIEAQSPLLHSWRAGRAELRNMCEIFECNFLFRESNLKRNRFYSTGCKLFRNKPCISEREHTAVLEMEDTFISSTMAATLQLGNRKFGIIGNTDDNSIIMELGVKVSN